MYVLLSHRRFVRLAVWGYFLFFAACLLYLIVIEPMNLGEGVKVFGKEAESAGRSTQVLMAIARFPVPVFTAVGHDQDHHVCDMVAYGKLVVFSDAAVVPRPTLDQFDAILGYAVDVSHRIGVKCPGVALVNFTEKVNEKFPHTLYYEELKRRAAEGRYGEACVSGPMDVKTALDSESGKIKGISSPVVGNADVLIFPNIESGNVFYKTISLFAGADMAGMLCGTTVPVVVASRADSCESKFYSLALACVD